MKIWNWSKMAMDREEWTRIVRQAKTNKEVLRYEKRMRKKKKKKELKKKKKRRRRKKYKKFHDHLIEAHLTYPCGVV